MLSQWVRVKSNERVRKLARLAFPDYRGRKYTLVIGESCTLHDTNWGGGSRSQYRVLHRDGGLDGFSIPAPWVNMVEGSVIPLDGETIVLEHSIFCGTDTGIKIHIAPSVAPKLLKG